ncbi:MAG: shikimate dehydrogenase [Burkholderiaceae bacterium]
MAPHNRFYLAGVMGQPVMHSRSPMLHNYWFAQQGLAGSYVPLAIAPEGLAAALRALQPLGFSGCNLTIPHKQEAMKIVDEVDAAARKIGEISCVTARPDGTLLGSNNDAFGFIRNVREAQPAWRADAGPIVVIGAGGGSRAVCYGLMLEGAKEIRLVNRHFERAQGIAQDFGSPIKAYPWEQRHDLLAGAAMVVNTTSQGMVGQTPLDIALTKLPTTALAADIVYIPLETPFLEAARLRGNPTVNGLGMLLHQGPLAWKAWFGIEPAVTKELRALVEKSL